MEVGTLNENGYLPNGKKSEFREIFMKLFEYLDFGMCRLKTVKTLDLSNYQTSELLGQYL